MSHPYLSSPTCRLNCLPSYVMTFKWMTTHSNTLSTVCTMPVTYLLTPVPPTVPTTLLNLVLIISIHIFYFLFTSIHKTYAASHVKKHLRNRCHWSWEWELLWPLSKSSWRFFKTLEREKPCDPARPLLAMCSQNSKPAYTETPMFTTALVKLARDRSSLDAHQQMNG